MDFIAFLEALLSSANSPREHVATSRSLDQQADLQTGSHWLDE
jgi:hypothetical protein